MQYIDNDMDDLFKKAGENYPLNIDGADWNAVQAKLSDTSDRGPIYPVKKNNRNYLWLLLLLFVPLFFVINTSKKENIKNATGTTPLIEGGNRMADNAVEVPVAGNDEKGSGQLPLSTALNERHAVIKNQADPLNKKENDLNDQKKKLNKENNYVIDNISDDEDHASAPDSKKIAKNNQPGGNVPSRRNNFLHDKNKKSTDNKNIKTSGGKNTAIENANLNESLTEDNILPAANEPIPVDSTTTIKQPKLSGAVSIINTNIDSIKDVSNTDAGTKTDSAKKSESRNKQKRNSDSKRGIYYGIVAGPDVSTIKSQQVRNAGYTIGGIIGYRINRHFAIESGALWDRKKYYTDGEYFDKTGTNIPPSVKVLFLNGNCNMFEFPLAVRYDLNMKKNSFFATMGLTSYIMKKENYDYGADNNGMYYESSRSYRNSGNKLFSNLQLSAGYNFKVSRKLDVRIEPYIKMPVKNIGIGNMPISSKGIYFGIIRNIK